MQFENFKNLFISCRPRQWTKNLLIFAAPLFNFQYERQIWFNSFLAIICFCLISSSIYLLNDSIDYKQDKIHPRKKYRPIASNKISIKFALIFSSFLLATSLFLAFITSKYFALILILYWIIQFFYCTYLKNIVLLDIFCIASGFILRASAGLIAPSLPNSPWFILSIGLLALYLAIEKRKAELNRSLKTNIITRKVLKNYSIPLLLRLESLVGTSSFITYSLWASGPLLKGAKSSWMMLTIPFVLFGIFRYQLISDFENKFRNNSEDSNHLSETPEEILIKDPGIKLSILGWLITTIIIGFNF